MTILITYSCYYLIMKRMTNRSMLNPVHMIKFENTTKVFGYLSYIYMIKKRVLAFQKNDLVKNRITISEQKIPGISKWGIRNKIISNSAAFFNKRSPSQNAELQSVLYPVNAYQEDLKDNCSARNKSFCQRCIV